MKNQLSMDSFIQWALSNMGKKKKKQANNQSKTISIRVSEQNKKRTKEMLVKVSLKKIKICAIWLWYDTDGDMVMRSELNLLFLHLAMLLPRRHAREHI